MTPSSSSIFLQHGREGEEELPFWPLPPPLGNKIGMGQNFNQFVRQGGEAFSPTLSILGAHRAEEGDRGEEEEEDK